MTSTRDELVEEIAALEHEQWMAWSKTVAPEVSEERRERWQRYWVPYEELSEDVKEHDRAWARKVIACIVERPLPGEVGRRDWNPNMIDRGIRTIRVIDWVKAMQGEGATRFIALRTREEE